MVKKRDCTFFDLYVQGKVLADEADDYIELWHSSSDDEDRELHEYLGLSWDEYQAFVSDPNVLPFILKARIEKEPLADIVDFAIKNQKLAARAQDVATLRNWLACRKK